MADAKSFIENFKEVAEKEKLKISKDIQKVEDSFNDLMGKYQGVSAKVHKEIEIVEVYAKNKGELITNIMTTIKKLHIHANNFYAYQLAIKNTATQANSLNLVSHFAQIMKELEKEHENYEGGIKQLKLDIKHLVEDLTSLEQINQEMEDVLSLLSKQDKQISKLCHHLNRVTKKKLAKQIQEILGEEHDIGAQLNQLEKTYSS